MTLRKITKMNTPNDGNRSFYESILNRNVLTSLKYLSHNNIEFIIIGELSISFHVKPYSCKDIKILVKDKNIIFKYFPSNICRNIKLLLFDLYDLSLTTEQYDYALKNSYSSDNFKIASPTFLISLFIRNLNINNSSDAFTICTNCPIKRDELFENISEFDKFIYKIKKDYTMKYLNNYIDYFKCKIYEGSSGYAEVDAAFSDWVKNTKDINQVLIGGMALVNYDIDRTTTDVDFLFLSKEDIPIFVDGFKHNRKSAFQHNKTHVEIEVVTNSTINLSVEFVNKIFDTSYNKGDFKIASPSAIVALKLNRLNDRDIKDIKLLSDNYDVNIDEFKPYLSEEQLNKYQEIMTIII